MASAGARHPLLTAEGLGCAFGGHRAVADVSLHVEPGEIVALIGPNGAGKTTLLNLVSGQQRPDTGRVLFRWRDVTRRPPCARERNGMLRGYQDGGMFAKLSALDNAVVPLLARGAPYRRSYAAARDALVRLGLGPVIEERAERLSGGQRKLVDFGRAMATPVDLILLDEPTTGVHPHVAGAMSRLIEERRRGGTAFLLVSHDLPWAFAISSRVIVMAAGEKLIEGTPGTVSDDPRVHEAYL